MDRNLEALEMPSRQPGAEWQTDSEEFARDVLAGLSATPKRLSCRYFYDAQGSLLFEEICRLEEYYLTRAEREILLSHSAEIARRWPGEVCVGELGSGSSSKTRILLGSLLRHSVVRYMPIDVSPTMLDAAGQRLREELPSLQVEPIATDYERGLAQIARAAKGPKLLLWLGSSIGNLDRDEAAVFLRRIRHAMKRADGLLVGIDLRKSRAVLERAYNDARQITARFNLNVLARINRELGGRFDLEAFRHLARYDAVQGRIEMFLESTRAQVVSVSALGRSFAFAAGERIHTESSYKYSVAEIDALARASGLEVAERWFDSRRLFSLNLLRPVLH